jgi:hypothetical protein
MKTIFAIFAASVLVVTENCRADLTNRLIGNWSGPGTTLVDGRTLKTSSIVTTRRFQENGLISTTALKIAGKGTLKGVLKYFDSGKVSGSLSRNGELVATSSGKWSVSSGVLTVRVKSSGLFPTFSQTTKTTLLSRRKMIISGSSSNGGRSIQTLMKQ